MSEVLKDKTDIGTGEAVMSEVLKHKTVIRTGETVHERGSQGQNRHRER
ncbi:MAG: hypothetical protein ACQEXB_03610 [Bacillota bacterium]